MLIGSFLYGPIRRTPGSTDTDKHRANNRDHSKGEVTWPGRPPMLRSEQHPQHLRKLELDERTEVIQVVETTVETHGCSSSPATLQMLVEQARQAVRPRALRC